MPTLQSNQTKISVLIIRVHLCSSVVQTTNNQQQITFSDFLKIDMRVGEILEVRENLKARKPAYILTIDFGHLGKKTSSAQITENYTKEELVGKQIIAVVNFPVKRVAGVKSEVLVLAAISPTCGTILLQPNQTLENGSPIS